MGSRRDLYIFKTLFSSYVRFQPVTLKSSLKKATS